MNTYGRDKVLFGTNFPMLDIGKCARQARDLKLDDQPRRQFLADNARNVFKLPI
jgi:predicted TIM-barrel fold metal-dependent hydrolase